MRVDVQRKACAAVTEHRGDRFHVHAALQRGRGEAELTIPQLFENNCGIVLPLFAFVDYELFFHLSDEEDEKGTYYTPLHLVNLLMDSCLIMLVDLPLPLSILLKEKISISQLFIVRRNQFTQLKISESFLLTLPIYVESLVTLLMTIGSGKLQCGEHLEILN